MILNLSTDIECTRFNILRFMNRKMLISIAFGAISLFAAVSATYMFTWYGNPYMEFAERQVLSQTVALCDLLGHISLRSTLDQRRNH
ncbi:MAG TPA: hypothetical protein VF893_09225 [Candidatus Bathyarchaeia archaeon]